MLMWVCLLMVCSRIIVKYEVVVYRYFLVRELEQGEQSALFTLT